MTTPGSAARGRAPRAAALLALYGLCGCAPAVRVDDALLARAAPTTVAVLPFELVLGPGERDEEGDGARRAEALRRAVARQVALRYRALPPDQVDAALLAAGLSRDQAPRLAAPRLTRELGVDAVVRGRVRSLDNIEGGLLFVHTIAADLRLVGAGGDVLAEVAHTERAIGGLLPESQQAIRALLATIENSTEAGFLRLAERFAEAAVRALPAPPRAPGAAPSIEHARLQAPERPLAAGDVVEVEVRGTPGLQAVLDLGPALRGVPLEEVEPGVYRGAHQVGLGEAGAGAAAARLRDPFGHGAWRALRAEPVVVAARPLGAPRDARRAIDPATGAGRVAWRAVPGAASYRVYVLAADGRASLIAATDRTYADLPRPAPPAGRLAVAAVDRRGAVGGLALVGAGTATAPGEQAGEAR